jgi:16S rRNA processing protein RimM
VKFAGIDDRTAAETVRGALYVSPERLRALAGDEYWEYEVVGCRVVDATGADVGVVTRVVPGSAQDLLAVDTERGERLVPMVSDIVVGVDVERRTVAVDPPAGLLD